MHTCISSKFPKTSHFELSYLNKKRTEFYFLVCGATKFDLSICLLGYLLAGIVLYYFYSFWINRPWFLEQIKFLHRKFSKHLVLYHKLVLAFGNYVSFNCLFRYFFEINFFFLPSDCILLCLICLFLQLSLFSVALTHWEKSCIMSTLLKKNKKKK